MSDWLEEREPVQVITGTALEVLQRAEIDMQISTAKKYPRLPAEVKKRIRALALLDAETAEACVYKLPRDGKMLEGPSVRLAEIVLSAWGNLRAGARVVDVGDDAVTAEGAVHDLETNVAITMSVRRSIKSKRGRFSSDMINVTGNAAASIALRNATFRVVPFAVVKPIVEECKAFAVAAEEERQRAAKAEQGKPNGNGRRAPDTRRQALDAFIKLGATERELFALLDVASIDDINAEHVVTLRSAYKAIRDGATTLDAVLKVARDRLGENAPAPEPQKTSALDEFLGTEEKGEELL